MADLELQDIQGLILFGHGHLEYAAYLFLHLTDGAAAREWVAQVVPGVTPAAADKSSQAVHLAFTWDGLGQIGLPEDGLATFPRQFQEGMTAPDRARILGDLGDEDPAHWEFGGTKTEGIHALLMLFARTPEAREELAARQEALLTSTGAGRIVWRENSERPRHNEEHFGFRDGLSQPAIEGSPVPRSRLPAVNQQEDTVKAGEFILGCENAYSQVPFSPTVASDPNGLLTPDVNDTGRLSLGRNGTYLVFRKLQQHVGPFWAYFRQQAEMRGASDPHAEMLRLAAKCVGRWPSGASLLLSPEADNKNPDNQFVYRALDPLGERCPIGAHVRRTNPRDMLAPDTTDNSETIGHHRLLRRGRPYGPCLIHPETDPDDGTDRGLLFLALNANLRRQFEFIQQTWVNTPTFGGLYTDRDPLLGDDPLATVTIPGCPVRTRLIGLPRFVTMRGGGYFFLPGLAALRYLAKLG